jgi:hypothetical protein
VCDCSL